MRQIAFVCVGVAMLASSTPALAASFTFNTDPFAGTTALQTPGRQIVGNEAFINFNPATDVFVLDPAVFGTGNAVNFINAQASGIPSTGVNVVVLETFDNDNNPATPFGAGNAADLIADRVTASGPGFFIYFNQALDLPRLVFSTDLSSHTADLKVLARMLNLNGENGRNTLPEFSAANFEFETSESAAAVPEPGSLSLVGIACLVGARSLRRRTGAEG
jgi:hypothetical protein